MNKYIRGLLVTFNGFLKTFSIKAFHPKSFKGVQLAQMSLFTEITIDGGRLCLGKSFKMRDNAKIRVRKNAECIIGNNVSINSNNIIVCRNKITIGDGTELSPNVLIYDHDHDFRVAGGLKEKKYITKPIEIGKNVWIGANSVILKGVKIGDNSVIAAGSVVFQDVPSNSVFVQRKNTYIRGF